MSGRPQRRILEATLAASLLGAAPSLVYSVRRDGLSAAAQYGVRGTRAIATLVPPGRPNYVVGAATHFAISAGFGQVLGRFLPLRRSALWGAAGGAAMGLVGAGLVGRRFNSIRELPFGPQLADNIAFGIIFALVADRASRRTTTMGSEPIRRSAFRGDALRSVPHPHRGLIDRPRGGM
jgi:hypothetical protein